MKVETQVTDERIKGMLCTAFEGGSNYWYQIDRYEFGKSGLTDFDFKKGGKMQDPDNYWHPAELVPLAEGCAVIISDNEGDNHGLRLDRAAIEKGLQIMAEKYPKHFADLVSENDDATTGDVFLQCCLFGEAKYG